MPFVEVVGNAERLPPEQMAGTCVNVGVIGALALTQVVEKHSAPIR